MGKHKVQSLVSRFVSSPQRYRNYFKDRKREREIDEAMDSRREAVEPEDKEVPVQAPEAEQEPENVLDQNLGPLGLLKWLLKEMREFLELTCIAGLISVPTAYIVELMSGVDFWFIAAGVGLFVASMSLALRIRN